MRLWTFLLNLFIVWLPILLLIYFSWSKCQQEVKKQASKLSKYIFAVSNALQNIVINTQYQILWTFVIALALSVTAPIPPTLFLLVKDLARQVLNLLEKTCPNTFLRTSMEIAIGIHYMRLRTLFIDFAQSVVAPTPPFSFRTV